MGGDDEDGEDAETPRSRSLKTSSVSHKTFFNDMANEFKQRTMILRESALKVMNEEFEKEIKNPESFQKGVVDLSQKYDEWICKGFKKVGWKARDFAGTVRMYPDSSAVEFVENVEKAYPRAFETIERMLDRGIDSMKTGEERIKVLTYLPECLCFSYAKRHPEWEASFEEDDLFGEGCFAEECMVFRPSSICMKTDSKLKRKLESIFKRAKTDDTPRIESSSSHPPMTMEVLEAKLQEAAKSDEAALNGAIVLDDVPFTLAQEFVKSNPEWGLKRGRGVGSCFFPKNR